MKYKLYFFLALFFGVILCIVFFIYKDFNTKIDEPVNREKVIIILSPHLDDAVLSLGGFISKPLQNVVVATFFSGGPKEAMKTEWDKMSGFSDSNEAVFTRKAENTKALKGANIINYDYLDIQYRKNESIKKMEDIIESDIKNLIEKYDQKEVYIYGPSVFPTNIGHPDHLIINKAFYNVISKNNNKHVSFYFYEDFPYIEKYKKHSNIPFIYFILEKYPNRKVYNVKVSLNRNDVLNKIKMIKAYTSQVKVFDFLKKPLVQDDEKFMLDRCRGQFYACEVVYKIN